MTSSINLDRSHYAAKWPLPKEGEFNDLQVVNQAGIDYAKQPDSQAKEDKLLEITKYFHGYCHKYAVLIVRGTLPLHNYNGDTRQFLKYFLPAGSQMDKAAFAKAAKHLHLAFPGHTITDLYDVLNTLLLRCVKKYDPTYVDKVRSIVKLVNRLQKKLTPKQKKDLLLTIDVVTKKVKFDATGGVRLLARKGYIKAVRGKSKKLIGYKTTKAWPPSKEFLSSGPVGFVYFVQIWFRYYLQEFIDDQMKTMEVRHNDKLLQLEHRTSQSEDMDFSQDIPSADGALKDANGQTWAADLTMMQKSLDISAITPAWVQSNTDPLFEKMTLKERQLIYMYYVMELPWKQLAENLGMSINQVQKLHQEVLVYLKGKFKVKPSILVKKED